MTKNTGSSVLYINITKERDIAADLIHLSAIGKTESLTHLKKTNLAYHHKLSPNTRESLPLARSWLRRAGGIPSTESSW